MVIRAPKGKAPYSGTPIGVEQSKQMISKLLRDYGASGVVWGDNFTTGEVYLEFVVEREGGGAVKYRVRPAPFMEKHRTYNPRTGHEDVKELPNWPRSLRLLYGWTKVKVESIAFGLTTIEQEFLAQTVIKDETGREATVGELVLPAIEAGGGRLALPSPKPRDRPNVQDAESKVVG